MMKPTAEIEKVTKIFRDEDGNERTFPVYRTRFTSPLTTEPLTSEHNTRTEAEEANAKRRESWKKLNERRKQRKAFRARVVSAADRVGELADIAGDGKLVGADLAGLLLDATRLLDRFVSSIDADGIFSDVIDVEWTDEEEGEDAD